MAGPFRPFGDIERARFIDRPNRFLVDCEREGRPTRAFLPNPGRLKELLLPGAVLYLVKEGTAHARGTEYTVAAVEKEGRPVMLHTHRTNDAAGYLIEEGLVPGLAGARIVRREVPAGRSRFDFLLADGRGEMLLEVKSCTLFGDRVAMFPDAVTARGARHLEELSAWAARGVRSAVLFVVHWPLADTFMPDYHTDLAFARTLLSVHGSIGVIPIAVEWGPDLSLSDNVRLLHVPWPYIEREAEDRGSYIAVLELAEDSMIEFGAGRRLPFRKGYYLYAGSAMAGLTARIGRHLRLRKRFHWHIDRLRAVSRVHAVLAIRSSARLECAIAEALKESTGWSVPGFGCSDCACPSHLFGTEEDPLRSAAFQRLLQRFRMDAYEP